jgi:hypothetical protein
MKIMVNEMVFGTAGGFVNFTPADAFSQSFARRLERTPGGILLARALAGQRVFRPANQSSI